MSTRTAAAGDRQQLRPHETEQLDAGAVWVDHQDLTDAARGVEVELGVGLITGGMHLDDELGALGSPLGSILRGAVELVGNPVVGVRAEQPGLVGGEQAGGPGERG